MSAELIVFWVLVGCISFLLCICLLDIKNLARRMRSRAEVQTGSIAILQVAFQSLIGCRYMHRHCNSDYLQHATQGNQTFESFEGMPSDSRSVFLVCIFCRSSNFLPQRQHHLSSCILGVNFSVVSNATYLERRFCRYLSKHQR